MILISLIENDEDIEEELPNFLKNKTSDDWHEVKRRARSNSYTKKEKVSKW